ncbi:MAG: flavodoxin family protein [Theionarchaea archaeon]|nr:flavodoxin family protein [Theionarchaea archaeon]
MKSLIICKSIHHHNTERVAKVMGEILDAPIMEPDHIDAGTLSEYDLIGFGSGIYFARHHTSLLELVDSLPRVDKKAFIFSTRGMGPVRIYHGPLRRRLLKKGFTIVAEFSCKGHDTNGLLRVIGGINKSSPRESDLERAHKFAETLKNSYV